MDDIPHYAPTGIRKRDHVNRQGARVVPIVVCLLVNSDLVAIRRRDLTGPKCIEVIVLLVTGRRYGGLGSGDMERSKEATALERK